MARDALGRPRSGSVPVSSAVHLAVLLLLLIVPLAADIALPPLVTPSPEYMLAAALPPPPAFVPAPARPLTQSPAQTNDVAPTIAPPEIRPDLSPASPVVDAQSGLNSGLPPGSGTEGSLGPPVPVPVPPVPPRPPGPVRVAELPAPPHKIVDTRPVYPDIARAAHIEGTVVLEAVLDTSGRVTHPRVIKPVP